MPWRLTACLPASPSPAGGALSHPELHLYMDGQLQVGGAGCCLPLCG